MATVYTSPGSLQGFNPGTILLPGPDRRSCLAFDWHAGSLIVAKWMTSWLGGGGEPTGCWGAYRLLGNGVPTAAS